MCTRPARPRAGLALAVIVMVACVASYSWAVSLAPGDFVLANNGTGQIWKLAHSDLAQTLISDGPLLTWVHHLTVDRQGRILVSDKSNAIVAVDPVTGNESVFASASDLGGEPYGLAVGPDGAIYVSLRTPGRILRLDPVTAAATTVTSGGLLSSPEGLTLGPDGQLYVAETLAPATGSIVRVDPGAGTQTLVSASSQFLYPFAIAVANGKAWTAQTGELSRRQGCFLVTQLSDGTTELSTISPWCRSEGIVISSDGTLLYSDCQPVSMDCYREITGIAGTPVQISFVGGPVGVVPDGVVATRRTSWGSLKTIYR